MGRINVVGPNPWGKQMIAGSADNQGAPPSERGVPASVYGALQASGFPFQTAVEHVIRNTEQWSVLAIEFPWTASEGGDQFLDIVAGSGQFVAGVECKKTQKEKFTFLLPQGGKATTVDRARLLYAEQIRDSTRRWELFCNDWRVGPLSNESAFCIVSTSKSGRDQRMLERDAGRLILGTDAYALRAARELAVSAADEPGRPFVPVLVTNAPLFVARYKPTEVSLESGEFATSPTDIVAVPWARFRKSFPSHSGRDLGDRTVFVVTASSLMEFLAELGQTVPAEPVDKTGRGHLPKD